MKIGVSSYSFERFMRESGADYIKICDLAKEIGFDCIEFIDLNTESPIETAKEIRKHCKKIGLEISAYTVGADLVNRDGEAEVKRLLECVDICEALGAGGMRHDLCYGSNTESAFDYKNAIKTMVPLIRNVTEYAKAKGIKTCSENHGYIFQNPHRVKDLIKAVNNENYGWLCDIGNFMCDDCEPLESVKIALPYIFHLHAKDFKFIKGGEQPEGYFPTNGGSWLAGTVLGHGVVPVKECIEVCKNYGYNGTVSLEFEGSEDCLSAIKEGFAFIKGCL